MIKLNIELDEYNEEQIRELYAVLDMMELPEAEKVWDYLSENYCDDCDKNL